MTKFSDLKLDPRVLKAIDEAGYQTPTPIQAGAIPHALEGRDVLGIAQTGTGKTASFTLPMITLLGRGRARARMPRSLVLCPTRELAAQVAENFDTYAKHTKLTKALLIGGVSFGEQDKLIDRGVDVLIATPGRLLDHFERGKLLLTGVQIMVVDEADRMLDMGFIPDIERIFQLTPFTRQTLFFSATMAPEIERITNTFLHSPERIEVARQATASETITQRLVEITPTRRDQTAKQKRELLRALILAEGDGLKNAMIFCNRKTEVDIVAKSLKKHGFDAAPIHGDLDQSQRTRTLDGFRDGSLKFLIASDVAARGLDVPAVSHVFNFDLPSHAEDYVHRIGRTGRAGLQGTAISLGTPSDDKYLAAIENLVKQTLPRGPVPEGFTFGASDDDEDRAGGREGGRDDRRGRGRGRDKDRGDRGDRGGRGNREPRGETRDALQVAAEDDLRVAVPEQADRPETVANPQPAGHGGDSRHGSGAVEDRREGRGEDRQGQGRDRGRDRDAERDRGGSRDRDHGRRDGRGDGRRDGGRDSAVIGMGNHVPDFMLSSFRTQPFDATRDEATPDEPAAMVVPEAQDAADEAEKPRVAKGRTGRPRGRKATTGTATDDGAAPAERAPNVGAPAEDRPLEERPTDDAVEDKKPAAPRRRRASRADSDQAAAAGTPIADAAEPAPKPRRTRRKKTDDAGETAGTAGAGQSADAGGAEAETPKPRRTRRKKVEGAEATEA